MSGWQKIGTAPRDGTAILVCAENFSVLVWTVRWARKWWKQEDGYNLLIKPTHWKPAPPSEADADVEVEEQVRAQRATTSPP